MKLHLDKLSAVAQSGRWSTAHAAYEDLPTDKKQAVDDAWTAVDEIISEYFGPTPKADEAERLIAAITRFALANRYQEFERQCEEEGFRVEELTP